MDYASLATLVQEQLADKGQPCTVTMPTVGTYDVETSTMVPDGTMVLEGYALEESRKYILSPPSGRVVEERVVWVSFPAMVGPGAVLEWDSDQWTVAIAEPVSPSGTVLINKLTVSR